MPFLTGPAEIDAKRWLQRAAEAAAAALCLRAKCGTVIVANGEIIGEGYNAPPLDRTEDRLCEQTFPAGKPKYDRTCCIHAEWRAIMDALAHHPTKLTGATLYFTRVDDAGTIRPSGQPFCTVCSRLALDTGIKSFVLGHETGICAYPTDEYNRLSYAYVHPIAAA